MRTRMRRQDGILRQTIAATAIGLLSVASVGQPDQIPSTEEPTEEMILSPDVLAPIRLTSGGIRPEERDSYFRVLAKARDGDLRQLKQAAQRWRQRRQSQPTFQQQPEVSHWKSRRQGEPFPTFLDLFKNPQLYHGRPVTLEGHVLKLIPIPASANEFGLDELYEAWLYTDDSQSNPAVIVCTALPQQMPRGTEVQIDSISVTGYFFKMYVYPAQDDQFHKAPLLLAQRLEWQPPDATSTTIPTPCAIVVVGFVGLVLGVSLWRLGRDRRRRVSSQEPAIDFAQWPPPTP